MSQAFMIAFVALVGALQAVQGPINNQLNDSMKNVWLAGCVVFGTSLAAFSLLFVIFHRPLPTLQDLTDIPWYAGLGGLLGATAVYSMLTLTQRMGAGLFNGALVTATILTSLVLDHFGFLGLEKTPLTLTRAGGGVLLLAGLYLLSGKAG
jgi:transporter family-2 protein